ncbi:hypothetical protein MAHJHV33_42110 [Mycobacterium avium subsp. hominissuis]
MVVGRFYTGSFHYPHQPLPALLDCRIVAFGITNLLVALGGPPDRKQYDGGQHEGCQQGRSPAEPG